MVTLDPKRLITKLSVLDVPAELRNWLTLTTALELINDSSAPAVAVPVSKIPIEEVIVEPTTTSAKLTKVPPIFTMLESDDAVEFVSATVTRLQTVEKGELNKAK